VNDDCICGYVSKPLADGLLPCVPARNDDGLRSNQIARPLDRVGRDDYDDFGASGGAERLNRPPDESAPGKLTKLLGYVFGVGLSPNAAACSSEDG
jgi:hypothetical protein